MDNKRVKMDEEDEKMIIVMKSGVKHWGLRKENMNRMNQSKKRYDMVNRLRRKLGLNDINRAMEIKDEQQRREDILLYTE